MYFGHYCKMSRLVFSEVQDILETCHRKYCLLDSHPDRDHLANRSLCRLGWHHMWYRRNMSWPWGCKCSRMSRIKGVSTKCTLWGCKYAVYIPAFGCFLQSAVGRATRIHFKTLCHFKTSTVTLFIAFYDTITTLLGIRLYKSTSHHFYAYFLLVYWTKVVFQV